MLKQLQKRSSEGFTIIEVLIVLAIAGLIMVVVFLAVPALQRSGRNNALNTDANNILSAVGTYVADNGGTLPNGTNPSPFVSGATAVSLTGPGTNAAPVKLGGNVTALTFGTTATVSASSAVGTVEIVTGPNGVCNATSTGLGTGGGTRSYAILYAAESGAGGTTSQSVKCVGS